MEEDLCKTCEHFWLDFPMPLEHYVARCDKLGLKPLDEVVPFPCLKCPFDSYFKKS